MESKYYAYEMFLSEDSDIFNTINSFVYNYDINNINDAMKLYDIWEEFYKRPVVAKWIIDKGDGNEDRIVYHKLIDKNVDKLKDLWKEVEKDEDEGVLLDRFGDIWHGFGAGQKISTVKELFKRIGIDLP